MKQFSAWLVLVMLSLPYFVQAEAEVDLVRETTRVVLEQLHFERDRLEKEPEYINQLVAELIIPHFQFELMSQLVLGEYWQLLDKPEQACFISGFRSMLVERYAYILLSYDNHQISYEPVSNIGEVGNRLVRQTISRNAMEPLPIAYAMQQDGQNWKVIDLIIDGVSLVRNYRGIFQSRIHIQGIDYFLRNFPGCDSAQ